MIEGYIKRFLDQYLSQYLENLDKTKLHISLLKGKIELTDLTLNNKILDGIFLPIHLKHGRIGKISISIPSLIHFRKTKIEVKVSDVFICLTTRPIKDWKASLIMEEYQSSKKNQLTQYENQANYFYQDQQGNKAGMNNLILQLIANLHVSVERIYLRVETADVPFAFGFLIPSLVMGNADSKWHPIDVAEDPDYMYKPVSLTNFTIFLERDAVKSKIDNFVKADDLKDYNQQEKEKKLGERIMEHLGGVFTDKIEHTYILHKFCLDARVQFLIKKKKVAKQQEQQKRNRELAQPDLKVQLVLGGLFGQNDKESSALNLVVTEDQILVMACFLSFMDIYGNYRQGVLDEIYEKRMEPDSPDVQEYVRLYQELQEAEISKDLPAQPLIKEEMWKIEEKYRTDLLIAIRKAVNDRFYGMLRHDDEIQELLKQEHKEPPKKKRDTVFKYFKKALKIDDEDDGEEDGGDQGKPGKDELKSELVRQKSQFEQNAEKMDKQDIKPDDEMTIEERIQKKFEKDMDMVDQHSQLRGKVMQRPQDTNDFTTQFQVYVTRVQIQVFEKTENVRDPYKNIVFFVIEKMDILYHQEGRPTYMRVEFALSNAYLRDFFTPNTDMPFILQTIFKSKEAAEKDQAIFLIYEQNPKTNANEDYRLKVTQLAQVYLYANLHFVNRLIKLGVRFLKLYQLYFSLEIQKAPPEIRKDIQSGSFYINVVKNAVSQQIVSIQNRIADLLKGEEGNPKFNIDVNVLSPKIVVNEQLLGEGIMIPKDSANITLDLGQIQISTRIQDRNKNIDYVNMTDRSKAYDIQNIKFGKIKLTIDYDYQLTGVQPDARLCNWLTAEDAVDITDEFNFGMQLKAAVSAKNRNIPQIVVNMKINDLTIYVSRKVIQTILRFFYLYQHGQLAATLKELYRLNSEDPSSQSSDDLGKGERAEAQSMLKQTDKKEPKEKQHKVSKQLSDDEKQSLVMEVNIIFYSLRVMIQQLKHPGIQDVQQKGHAAIESEYQDPFYGKCNYKPYDMIEIGITAIKAHLTANPKKDSEAQLLIKKIYVKNADKKSKAEYLFLVVNPQLEQKIKKEVQSLQSIGIKKRTQALFAKAFPSKFQLVNAIKSLHIDVHFDDFKQFQNLQRVLDEEHQLTVELAYGEHSTEIDATFLELRVVVIMPLITFLYCLYVDIMVDISHVQKEVVKFINGIRDKAMQHPEESKQYQESLIYGQTTGNTSIDGQRSHRAGTIDLTAAKAGPKSFIVKKNLNIKENERSQVAFMNAARQEVNKIREDKKDDGIDDDLQTKTVTKHLTFKVRIIMEQVQVLFPSNLFDKSDVTLTIQTRGEVLLDSATDRQEIRVLDGKDTLKEAIVAYQESKIIVDLEHLTIYVEEANEKPSDILAEEKSHYEQFEKDWQRQFSKPEQQHGEKMFFLHPYDFAIMITTSKQALDDKRSISKTHIDLKGEKFINLQIGFKELNSYLLLAQLIFQFLNDYTEKTAEIDPVMKRQLESAQGIKDAYNKKEAPQDYTLKQILFNQGLTRPRSQCVINMWKKAITKVVDLVSQKDFQMSYIAVKIKGVNLSIVDNIEGEEQPLLLLTLQDIDVKMDSSTFARSTPAQVERLLQLEKITYPINDTIITFFVEMNYYNRNNFAMEPLIEKVPFQIIMFQQSPLSLFKQRFQCLQMLNINITYGLACSIQRTIKNLVQFEKLQQVFEEMKLERKQCQSKNDAVNQELVPVMSRSALSAQAVTVSKNFYTKCRTQQLQYLMKKQKMRDLKLSELYNLSNELDQAREQVEFRQVPIYNINPEESLVIQNEPIFSDVTEFVFLNLINTDVRFCLHQFGRVMTHFGVPHLGQANPNIKILPAGCRQIYTMNEFDEVLLQNQQQFYQDQGYAVTKIDFEILGYKKVSKVVLQRNGVFGFYLYPLNKNASYENGDTSPLSCIVRIVRQDTTVYCHFESSLVFFNHTKEVLNLRSVERGPTGALVERYQAFPNNEIFTAPMSWFVNETSLYINGAPGEVNPENFIMKDLQDIFDPRVEEPHHDHSKVVRISNKYLAVDIICLATKTDICQFLVTVQPIIHLTNLLFMDLTMATQGNSLPKVIKTNESAYMEEVNPYMEEQRFSVLFRDGEYIAYQAISNYKVKDMTKNKVTGLKNGFFVQTTTTFKDNKEHVASNSKPKHVDIVFESIQQYHSLKDTNYDKLSLRKKIYSKSKSLTYLVYFPYVAVNQTSFSLVLKNSNTLIPLKATSNTFFNPIHKKMQVTMEHFRTSSAFDIDTYGVTGAVRLNRKDDKDLQKIQKQQKKKKNFKRTEQEEYVLMDGRYENVEFGTYITSCPHPYNRTKVVKFTPRFFVINKLQVPIVIKEKYASHQTPIIPNEGLPLNFYSDKDLIQIRMLDFMSETQAVDYNKRRMTASTGQQIGSGGPPVRKFSSRVGDYQKNQQNAPKMHAKLDKNQSRNQKNDDNNGQFEQQQKPLLFDEEDEEEREIHMNHQLGYISTRNVWSYSFDVNTIDDFQVALKNPNTQQFANKTSWSENEDVAYIRVTVAPKIDNDGIILVTISKPTYPDYIFYNQTNYTVSVSHEALNAEDANDEFMFMPGDTRTITLNPTQKENDELVIKMYINGPTSQFMAAVYNIDSLKQEIYIDQGHRYEVVTRISGNLRYIHIRSIESIVHVSTIVNKPVVVRNNNISTTQVQMVPFQTDTAIKTTAVAQKSPFDGIKDPAQLENIQTNQFFDPSNPDFLYQKGKTLNQSQQQIKFRGIGISLVDFQPHEICYISLLDVKGKITTRQRQNISFSILNFQIDNQTHKSFEVILGSLPPYSYRERQFKRKRYEQDQSLVAQGQRDVIKNKSLSLVDDRLIMPFIEIIYETAQTIDGPMQYNKIKRLEAALKETKINIHGYFINNLLALVMGINGLIPDTLINDFFNSRLMANYNKLMAIISWNDIEGTEQDGQGALPQKYSEAQKRVQESQSLNEKPSIQPVADSDFIKQKQQMNQLGDVCEILILKEDVCPMIRPDQVEIPQDYKVVNNKYYVEYLSIKAIRLHLTIRIKKLENPMDGSSIIFSIINAISNFVNISDAEIYFSELEIENSYNTMSDINSRLMKHYIGYAVAQFYKILGSTDIIGNPSFLIKNLGRGVKQLYTEPQTTRLDKNGNPKRGRGRVKGLIKHSTLGISNSVSKATGTAYLGLKGLAGRYESESNLENPHNIGSGIKQGAKGFVVEIGQGVAGVVTVPRNRAKRQGCGCGSLTKGCCQGLFGLITTPFNACFKAAYNVSTGFKNQSKGRQINSKRIRFPRYINEREVIRPYNPEQAHAFNALQLVCHGLFRNEAILAAYDISNLCGPNLDEYQERVLFITEDRMYCVQNLSKIIMMLPFRNIMSVSLCNQNANAIEVVLTNGARRIIQTDKPDANTHFVKSINKILVSNQIVAAPVQHNVIATNQGQDQVVVLREEAHIQEQYVPATQLVVPNSTIQGASIGGGAQPEMFDQNSRL